MAGAMLNVQPKYQALLARHGLIRFEDFFDLQGLIVSGHPGRNVCHVQLGSGPYRLRGFLKREYQVRWQDRLANAWEGFGFVSRSRREAQILQSLPRTHGPECLASGDDGRGRAFVFVAEKTDVVELRAYLHRCRLPLLEAARDRRTLARSLGILLAKLHKAGVEHRGLYAKHVMVQPSTNRLTLIDWQRARRQGRPLDWPARLRDLAALEATLAADLASPRERLICLRSYLNACDLSPPATVWIVRRLGDLAAALLHKRRVSEIRHSQPTPEQGVLWLDGEALCVTSQFHADLRGKVPGWLRKPDEPVEGMTRTVVPLPGGKRGLLVWRRRREWLGWLWSLVWGRPLITPEVREAGLLFRRQRHGQPTARLLAFGQRRVFPGRTESFLLTELTQTEGRKAG